MTTSDPRALLRQVQQQTQASRYAQALREASVRLAQQAVRKA